MANEATIQKILALEPIEGADRIERASVLGWGVVVKRGEFQVGDLCVFVSIDSVLPSDAPWAEFMRERNFRVKTAKLRGCLSQGLVFPRSILPKVPAGCDVYSFRLSEEEFLGSDVSEILRVTHYEKPEAGGVIGGQDRGPFPPIAKTDEVRLQSHPRLLEELKGLPIVVTVKIDGTSGTFVKMHTAFGPYQQGEFLVCTRNRCIRRPEKSGNAYWEMADRYNLAEVIPEGYAVQGEVAGGKNSGQPPRTEGA